MRVTLLGHGCPVLHPRRAGAGLLVEAGGTRVLVDCGHGVAQRPAEAGVRIADLDGVLASHLHTDHPADLRTLVVGGWHQGRTRPLPLLADPAVERLALGLEAAGTEDASGPGRAAERPRYPSSSAATEPHGQGRAREPRHGQSDCEPAHAASASSPRPVGRGQDGEPRRREERPPQDDPGRGHVGEEAEFGGPCEGDRGNQRESREQQEIERATCRGTGRSGGGRRGAAHSAERDEGHAAADEERQERSPAAAEEEGSGIDPERRAEREAGRVERCRGADRAGAFATDHEKDEDQEAGAVRNGRGERENRGGGARPR